MEVEIIDNFLDKKTFKTLQQTLLAEDFPWYVYHGVTERKAPFDGPNYSFMHLLYQNAEPNSDFFKVIAPFLDKLDITAIFRIKANLYPKTPEIVEHDLHSDAKISHKGALLCLNTNDGYTYMEDGQKIQSVENRVIRFNPSLLHGSTTCTNENYRVNVLVNYF